MTSYVICVCVNSSLHASYINIATITPELKLGHVTYQKLFHALLIKVKISIKQNLTIYRT